MRMCRYRTQTCERLKFRNILPKLRRRRGAYTSRGTTASWGGRSTAPEPLCTLPVARCLRPSHARARAASRRTSDEAHDHEQRACPDTGMILYALNRTGTVTRFVPFRAPATARRLSLCPPSPESRPPHSHTVCVSLAYEVARRGGLRRRNGVFRSARYTRLLPVMSCGHSICLSVLLN